jgi:hypothetical protein
MIDDDKKRRVKTIFNAFLALSEDKKEIANQMKDEVKEAAAILEVKSKIITKLFASWKKKMETSEDEIADLSLLSVELDT